MNNLNITIGNSLNSYVNTSLYTFYSTDKFLYINFNETPPCDLTGKFINKNTKRSIEVPIEVDKLKKGSNISKTSYCTVPAISLYGPSSINEWTLNIYNNSSKKIEAQFDLLVIVGKNYFTGKSNFINETCCGIFYEKKG